MISNKPHVHIPGHPDYMITNDGEVYSLRMKKWLIPVKNRDGYWTYRLSGKTKQAQRLVLESFIGPCPSRRHRANHKDGNKINNLLTNLEWVTHQQNIQHSYTVLKRQAARTVGSKNPMSRLDETKVKEIKLLITQDLPYKKIAQKYKVSVMSICNIAVGRTWRHVK